MFLGLLGMCETNSYMAFCKSVKWVPRHEYRAMLSYFLLREVGVSPVLKEYAPGDGMHTYVQPIANKGSRVCAVCRKRKTKF